MIEVRCLHSLAGAEPFRQAINDLNRASARPDPFATFEFYQNYLRNPELFPAGDRLWLLLAFDGANLVGYLALRHRMHRVLGLRAARLDLLTAFNSDRPGLVARPEDASAASAAIYGYLLSRKKEWSLLEFEEQDAASPLLPPPAPVAGACRVEQWPTMPNGTIPLRWPSTAAYFAALSKKFRSNVSRQMRTLMAAGDVQVLSSSDPQALAPLFELYRSIEPHSWKARADAVISRARQSVEYYAGLMDSAQPMRVWIQLLLLEGVPVAGLITGAFGQGLYALHIVYDGRFARLAPGQAILLMGVRLAIEKGHDFFNLLRGFGYYKERWLAQMHPTQSLQIYRKGSPFYWRRLIGNARRRWSRQPAAEPGVLFNPARRDAEILEPGEPGMPQPDTIDAGRRAHFARLIAQVQRGRGEFLTAAQLAAVLPFETLRKDDRSKAPQIPSSAVDRSRQNVAGQPAAAGRAAVLAPALGTPAL